MKRTLILLFAMLIVFSDAMCQKQGRASNKFTIHQAIPFCQAEPTLTLDLYEPDSTTETTPCIVVIQGGGFAPQTGDRFKPFAKYIANKGYAVALISYRGRPDHQYQTTLADVKSSVRYVRENAAKYNIDPDCIGAMGLSAGATLTALLATTADSDQYRVKGENTSDRINAGVCYCGVFDLIGRFSEKEQVELQPRYAQTIPLNAEWVGESFNKKSKLWADASAINHVSKKSAPMLLMHCKDDALVPWLQTEQMYKALKMVGAVVEVKYFPSGGHGFRTSNPEENRKVMMDFFLSQFGK